MIDVISGTLFIDIDGTILKAQTEEPFEKAIETIDSLAEEGWKIILTTLRGDNWSDSHKYGRIRTLATLKRINLKYHAIIWDCPSPRIVLNDEGAFAISSKSNSTNWDEIKLFINALNKINATNN
jgi:ribonucleotide monophosphatase NagD (HAD superfamily)